MWLDEALSVNIARLPFDEVFEALRQDGSPPLYYLLLHGWTAAFGSGTDAARSLSTLFSLLTLPVVYLSGRRLGGPRAGAASLLLLAASPFAIRYATEARMYALLMLLCALWLLAVLRALERPTPGRLAVVALVAGLLALTHYWALFLLATAELLLLVAAYRQHRPDERQHPQHRLVRRDAPWRLALTMPLAAVLFLPWLPTFWFQTQHTGTPWAPTPTWSDGLDTVRMWSGPDTAGLLLFLVLAALALWSLRGRAGRWLLVLALGALVLGLVSSRVFGAGYALRYSAADLVPVLLAAGLGLAHMRVRLLVPAAAVVAVLGLVIPLTTSLLDPRTQAGDTAALLRARLQPDDLVVYCPDQLGPAVDRLLPRVGRSVVYPTMAAPQRIDWVDYETRNEAGSPSTFAEAVDATTTGTIWLVGNNSYRTFADQCSYLDIELTLRRGDREQLQVPGGSGESEWLVGYGHSNPPLNDDQR
jgi:hypothetical protein